ncbi:MAG TPA: hypothetical protein VN957_03140 [Chthoniobacterales bacterium]|jgi:hypothetical protein|nr:hypothetical protein [Chthoniobacterales bacterium]
METVIAEGLAGPSNRIPNITFLHVIIAGTIHRSGIRCTRQNIRIARRDWIELLPFFGSSKTDVDVTILTLRIVGDTATGIILRNSDRR